MHPVKAWPGEKMGLTCQSAHCYYSRGSHHPCAAPQPRGGVAEVAKCADSRARQAVVHVRENQGRGVRRRRPPPRQRKTRNANPSGEQQAEAALGRSSAVLHLDAGHGHVHATFSRAHALMI